MKKFIGLLFLFIGIGLLWSPQAKATHTSAFEFYYHWKSDSTYEFTLIFYRHCTGFTASSPTSVSVEITSDSLNYSFNAVLIKMPTMGTSVPPLNPIRTYNCYPDSSLCVEEYVYRGNITFPMQAHDWEISEDVCCRPTEIDNITGSSMRALCGLNNLDFQDSIYKNTSPLWHTRRPNIPGHLNDTIINYPVWNVCEYQDYEIDQSVVEYEGDSISYELIQFIADSFATNIATFAYVTPFSDTFMLPTDSAKPLSIDPVTGIVSYSPIMPPIPAGYIRMFQFAIKATEYRYDSFLVGPTMIWEARPMGFQIRNIQVITTDSSVCPKAVVPFGDTIGNFPELELNCIDSLISLTLPFNVLCETVDTNASCFLLLDTATLDTLSLKAAWMVNCFRTGEGYQIMIEPDSLLNKGPYYLLFKQGDDSNTAISTCGSEIIAYYDTLVITVDTSGARNLLGDYQGNGNYDSKYTLECNVNQLTIYLSEKVLCSTVASDGSDFTIADVKVNPPTIVPILNAVPIGCSNGSTNKIRLNLLNIPGGSYAISIKSGSDGNVFENYCGDEWQVQAMPLIAKYPTINLGPDKYYCMEQVIQEPLSAYKPEFVSYFWSTGATTPNITARGAGTIRVMASTRLGCFTRDTIELIRINCVGIDEVDENAFKIYPNPVHDVMYIDHASSDQVDIQIFDALGKLVLAVDEFSLDDELDVSILQNGFYVLKLDDGLKRQQVRFIKQ